LHVGLSLDFVYVYLFGFTTVVFVLAQIVLFLSCLLLLCGT